PMRSRIAQEAKAPTATISASRPKSRQKVSFRRNLLRSMMSSARLAMMRLFGSAPSFREELLVDADRRGKCLRVPFGKLTLSKPGLYLYCHLANSSKKHHIGV